MINSQNFVIISLVIQEYFNKAKIPISDINMSVYLEAISFFNK